MEDLEDVVFILFFFVFIKRPGDHPEVRRKMRIITEAQNFASACDVL